MQSVSLSTLCRYVQICLEIPLSGNCSYECALFVLRLTPTKDLPFEKLVEELRQERDLSRNPLFQVMFVFQNISDPALKFPGVKSASVEINTGNSKFDLTLSFTEEDNRN